MLTTNKQRARCSGCGAEAVLDPIVRGSGVEGFDVFCSTWECGCGRLNAMPGCSADMLPSGLLPVEARPLP
jgi:hypothetical protein